MDRNIINYRKKHKKCKWCQYYQYQSPSSKILGLNCADYEECILKDKIIHFTNKNHFCKYYQVKKEEDNAISINKFY